MREEKSKINTGTNPDKRQTIISSDPLTSFKKEYQEYRKRLKRTYR